MPKELGGLGVMDLKMFNRALLLKWYWLWFKPERKMWKPLFNSTARLRLCVPQTMLFTTIEKDMHTFFNISTTSIPGNGMTISMWEHNWGVRILKMEFPNLYSYAISGSTTLRQAKTMQPLTNFFKPNLSAKAHEELAILQQHLTQLTLNSDSSDDIVWNWSKTGLFTMKSAYKALKGGPKVLSSIRGLWSANAPPKMKIFGWLAIKNKILTQDNLRRRGWCIASMCILCRSGAESVRHLFGDCSYTKEVFDWLKTVRQSQSWPTEPIIGITDNILNRQLSGEQRSALIIMQFIVWRERCSRIFQGVNKTTGELLDEIENQLRLLQTETTRAQLQEANQTGGARMTGTDRYQHDHTVPERRQYQNTNTDQ